MKSSRLRDLALQKEKENDETLQIQRREEQKKQEQEEQENLRRKHEATCAIRRFIHLTLTSLDHMGEPLEVGTNVQVYWGEDNAWYDGSIDAYDPTSDVHGVLYSDGEREDLILSDEIFKIVSYPEPLNEMKYESSHDGGTYCDKLQPCQYTEDFCLPIDITLALPPDDISGD